MKIQLNDTNGSKVTKKAVETAILDFIKETPKYEDHDIKILAIVLMAHGGEINGSPDW